MKRLDRSYVRDLEVRIDELNDHINDLEDQLDNERDYIDSLEEDLKDCVTFFDEDYPRVLEPKIKEIKDKFNREVTFIKRGYLDEINKIKKEYEKKLESEKLQKKLRYLKKDLDDVRSEEDECIEKKRTRKERILDKIEKTENKLLEYMESSPYEDDVDKVVKEYERLFSEVEEIEEIEKEKPLTIYPEEDIEESLEESLEEYLEEDDELSMRLEVLKRKEKKECEECEEARLKRLLSDVTYV